MTTDRELIETIFGPIWAHAVSGNTMVFHTGFGDHDSQERNALLVVHGKTYRFDFTLTTRPIPGHRHTFFQRYGPNDDWRVIDTGAEHRALKAPTFEGKVTTAASSTARLKILPMLGEWLGSDRARVMLEASAEDERQQRLSALSDTLTALGEAVVILEAIRRKLERNEPLTDEEASQVGSAGSIENWLETGRFPR